MADEVAEGPQWPCAARLSGYMTVALSGNERGETGS